MKPTEIKVGDVFKLNKAGIIAANEKTQGIGGDIFVRVIEVVDSKYYAPYKCRVYTSLPDAIKNRNFLDHNGGYQAFAIQDFEKIFPSKPAKTYSEAERKKAAKLVRTHLDALNKAMHKARDTGIKVRPDCSDSVSVTMTYQPGERKY